MLAAKDYVSKRRDSQLEFWLAKELRTQPEAFRAAFVSDWLRPEHLDAPGYMYGFDLLRTLDIRDKQLLKIMLIDGLGHANASDIRYWLEGLVPALGATNVASVLSQMAGEHANVIDNAAYWLKGMGWTADQIDGIRAARIS